MSCCVRADAGCVVIQRPSRRTVTRSANASTSSSLCEMYAIPTPCRCSLRMNRISTAVSAPVRTAVGSSMISTRTSRETAFAISTIWRCATVNARTGLAGSRAQPSSSSTLRARSRIVRTSRNGPRRTSRPRKMFSTTDRWAARFSSWWISTTPCASASAMDAKATGAPLTRMAPVPGRTCPARIFSSVDFPAPFSPTSAWTSPGATLKSMSCSTRTGPNDFDIPFAAKTGSPAPTLTPSVQRGPDGSSSPSGHRAFAPGEPDRRTRSS